MREPSIRRQLMIWVLGALLVGAPALALAAYWLTLNEIDELLNDGLKQTALLLADRDLRGPISLGAVSNAAQYADTESKLVAIARAPSGELLFTSEPAMSLEFESIAGISLQRVNDEKWHVYTIVQRDRTVQVAQPLSVRHELAAESSSKLLVPLLAMIGLIGLLLVSALRRGMKPLAIANAALAQRNAHSLKPLDVQGIPTEILPVVRTLNDLLQRLATTFKAQREFVADAAHELRSPVTALQLQVQILERSRDPAERALAMEELVAGIGRARRLIEQLLHLSRASADDDGSGAFMRERVALAGLVRDAVVQWAAEAQRRSIDLGADIRTDASVAGSAAQLEILLRNLIENALRYTPSGGRVDVVAEVIDGVPRLSVIDNGPGIPAADRERVFDRFYRSPQAVASAQPGSGLGLSIVKSIADRHGATTTLEDGPDGNGLVVHVTFAT
jgi:two-component system OmpR family sensor kinase